MSDIIQSPVPPDLRALLDSFKADVFAACNVHKVGTIVSFNATKQTASVQISELVNVGGVAQAYPVLTDCPVYFPAGGGAYFYFPVAKGDTCLVAFHDTDLDKWFTTGNTTTPNTTRTHSLSDGMVFVGIRSLAQPVPTHFDGAVSLHYKNAVIGITDAGEILIRSAVNGSKIELTNKILIQNNATSLKSAMDQLFSALTAWVNTGGSTPNAATISALNSAQATMQSVLT